MSDKSKRPAATLDEATLMLLADCRQALPPMAVEMSGFCDMNDSVAELAQRLGEATGKPPVACEQAAALLVIAWIGCHAMRVGFSDWKPEPSLKFQARQLERLTRKNPRADAVRKLSPQTASRLEGELRNRGEWSADWKNRPPRELSHAARDALDRLRAFGTSAGRPPDHPITTFVATAAHIAETVLGVQPSGAPGAVFRRVVIACAEVFGIHTTEFTAAGLWSGSRRITAAVQAYRNGTLPFGLAVGVAIVNR